MRAVSTRLALAGALTALLALAVATTFAGELKRKSRTIAVPDDNQAHFTNVDCPQGTKATGGGGEAGSAHQDASFPSAAREWTASALGVLGAEELTVHVICLKKDAANFRRASSSALPTKDLGGSTGVLARATATCPAGTRISGGGLEAEPEDAVAVSSYASGRRAWTAEAVFFVKSVEGVTAHAVCVKGRKVMRRSETVRLPDDSEVHAARVKCPRGTKPTGGGFAISDPAESFGLGSFPSGKRRWTGRGLMLTTGDDAELTAHVLCLKKPRN